MHCTALFPYSHTKKAFFMLVLSGEITACLSHKWCLPVPTELDRSPIEIVICCLHGPLALFTASYTQNSDSPSSDIPIYIRGL